MRWCFDKLGLIRTKKNWSILQPKNLIPREDLFQKMVDQDYQAPLLEEVKQQAVTKERCAASIE